MNNIKITSQDVKKLRELTAASMADCKNALIEAGGDLEQAIVVLQKKELKFSAPRQENELKYGAAVTSISQNYGIGVALLLVCETNFVAAKANFIELAKTIAKIALEHQIKNIDKLMYEKIDNVIIKVKIDELINEVGENIRIIGLSLLEADYVCSYIHKVGEEHKAASLIALNIKKEAISDTDKELAHKIAMQIVSMKPLVAKREQVPLDMVKQEMEIILDNLSKENKPQNITDLVKKDKLDKFYKNVCLVEQPYLFDEKQNVETILANSNLECIQIARFEIG